MRIRKYLIGSETTVGIKFKDVITWIIFCFFLEIIFPILLDPLNIFNEYFGYEMEDVVELCFFLIVPFLVAFWSDRISGFAFIIALVVYLFFTSFPLELIYMFIFSDFFVFLSVVALISDMLGDMEGETTHDGEIY